MKKKIKLLLYYLFYPLVLRKVSQFKNKHEGEEVYILADSTEVRFMDLGAFDDKPMICFNMSYFINEISDRKMPTYGHLIESFYFYKTYKFKNKTLKLQDFIKVLIKNKKIIFFTNLTNILNFIGVNTNFVFLKLPKDQFTQNELNKNRLFSKWSVKTAISLAIYMGFKKAYLIGFSFTSEAFANHWFDDLPIKSFKEVNGIDAVSKLRNNKGNNEFFKEADNHIKVIGITISKPNESYFEWIEYAEFTGLKKQYREIEQMSIYPEVIEFLKLSRIAHSTDY